MCEVGVGLASLSVGPDGCQEKKCAARWQCYPTCWMLKHLGSRLCGDGDDTITKACMVQAYALMPECNSTALPLAVSHLNCW